MKTDEKKRKKKNKLQKLKIICFSNFIAPIHPHGGFLLFSYFRHITFKLPAAGTYIPTGEIRASCNTGSQRWVPPEALSHVLDYMTCHYNARSRGNTRYSFGIQRDQAILQASESVTIRKTTSKNVCE